MVRAAGARDAALPAVADDGSSVGGERHGLERAGAPRAGGGERATSIAQFKLRGNYDKGGDGKKGGGGGGLSGSKNGGGGASGNLSAAGAAAYAATGSSPSPSRRAARTVRCYVGVGSVLVSDAGDEVVRGRLVLFEVGDPLSQGFDYQVPIGPEMPPSLRVRTAPAAPAAHGIPAESCL